MPNVQCPLMDGLPQCAAQAIAQRAGGVGRLLKQRDQRVPHNWPYDLWKMGINHKTKMRHYCHLF
ncbi:hypothetical protein M5585_11290 [Serratia ureilytica]